MGPVHENVGLTFFPEPKNPDPRTLERWKRRLDTLSNAEGFIVHATLRLTNNRIFYVSEVRHSVKAFLARFLPSFIIKLEGDWQDSGLLFTHAHVLLPVDLRVRPFLVSLRMSGAKVVRTTYKGQVLPDPFSLFPDQGPVNALEYLVQLPDISGLTPLVKFEDSTISTFLNSPDLPNYMGKITYRGGLSPVIEHGIR